MGKEEVNWLYEGRVYLKGAGWEHPKTKDKKMGELWAKCVCLVLNFLGGFET